MQPVVFSNTVAQNRQPHMLHPLPPSVLLNTRRIIDERSTSISSAMCFVETGELVVDLPREDRNCSSVRERSKLCSSLVFASLGISKRILSQLSVPAYCGDRHCVISIPMLKSKRFDVCDNEVVRGVPSLLH